jgi:hypothetical protein
MKNIFKIIGIVIFTAGILFACKESFLDGPAQGVLDQSTLGNQDGVEANLISAYSILDGYAEYGGWGNAGSNWIFGSVTSDDAYKGSEPGDQQPAQDAELYQWTTAGVDGYLNDKFSSLYDGVARCNATLNLMRDVLEADPDAISAENASRIEGEAIFLRAHYHFDAWKFWGNIPYYTEADENFKKANIDAAAALDLIIADLDAAIAKLPETQGDVGRVTKWAAKAYKGRVLMFKKDYSGALSVLSDVVNNGPYDLEATFHDVFSVQHDNGPETILAYQASSNDGNPNGNNGNYSDRLNFPHSGSPLGCCGFHQPSQNLVNVFQVDANGLPLLDGSWDDAEEADITASTPVDPRLDWTVGRDGVPYLDWGIHEAGWIRARQFAGPYSPKKTIYEKNSGAQSAVGWQNTQLHSMNYHLLRYADVMLMLAEAEVEVGSLENARTLVNEIRIRAAESGQGPDGGDVQVPIDDAGITYATYQIGTYDAPWTDQATARAAVRMERRLELAMEGHRLFDLKRWGVAKEVLNAYVAKEETRREYLTAAVDFEDKHMLFPLPITQIELSTIDGVEQLVQNPGW